MNDDAKNLTNEQKINLLLTLVIEADLINNMIIDINGIAYEVYANVGIRNREK